MEQEEMLGVSHDERRLIRIGKGTLFSIKHVLDHIKGILLPLFTHFVNI